MALNEYDQTKMTRALRAFLLEASEEELRYALDGTGEDIDSLADQGRAAVERALAEVNRDSAQVEDLHRGLGALIQTLRRRDRLSLEEVAKRASVDVDELRSIEIDPTSDPNPRTICQLEQYFSLPPRSLVVLSGAVDVEESVREEAVSFSYAASSKNINKLSREEKNVLNRFVKFLGEHTD